MRGEEGRDGNKAMVKGYGWSGEALGSVEDELEVHGGTHMYICRSWQMSSNIPRCYPAGHLGTTSNILTNRIAHSSKGQELWKIPSCCGHCLALPSLFNKLAHEVFRADFSQLLSVHPPCIAGHFTGQSGADEAARLIS